MEIIIKRRALLSALAGAKAAHPNEFICLLVGKADRSTSTIVIEDTMIPPGIMVSETMSSFSEWMMPVIEGLVGIFHSHPDSNTRPSRQDRHLFSQKGGVNLIAGYPFGLKNVSAYVAGAKEAPFRIVD